MSAPPSKIPPVVTGGQGKITVNIIGEHNEQSSIVVTQNGTEKGSHSRALNGNGQLTQTFNLPAGNYDVTVTVGSPNGAVFNYHDVHVS